MEIVEAFLKNISVDTPVIFDGIPRSEVQRISLENELKKAGRDFQVLEITLSNKTALNRLLRRAKCNDCGTTFGGNVCPKCGSNNISRRADDNEKSIQKRLNNFDEHTAPIIEIWKKQGKVISVDGEKTIDDCYKEILEKLDA
jgi:adenylate kinase